MFFPKPKIVLVVLAVFLFLFLPGAAVYAQPACTAIGQSVTCGTPLSLPNLGDQCFCGTYLADNAAGDDGKYCCSGTDTTYASNGLCESECAASICILPPLDISLVVDESGSMGGPIMTDVIAACHDLVNLLDFSKDRVAIITFSGVSALKLSFSSNKTTIDTQIDTFTAGGGTDIGAGIDEAWLEIQANGRVAPAKQIMIVLTDGAGGAPVAAAVAPKAGGVKIFTIGLGAGIVDATLTNTSSQDCAPAPVCGTNHCCVPAGNCCYYKSPTSAELSGIFESILISFQDPDGDGYITHLCPCPDPLPAGILGCDDCSDYNSCIFPGAIEDMATTACNPPCLHVPAGTCVGTCVDGVDNDCDGLTDDEETFCVVCGDGSCDFPETSIVDFGFEVCCAIACGAADDDCGCDNDTFCDAERGENFWNCALDCAVAAGADCLCQENAKDLGGESLVPCGRNFDDRDTVSICECCPCTFCHTFLLMKRITDFAVKRGLPAILVLTVMIAGALYLLGGFSGAFISKANDMFKIMGIGTAVIFAGWVVINLALYTITGNQTGSGVAQVFAGRWDEISCSYGVTCATARCGDGIVQRPNFNGLDEECEKEERWEGYKARAKAGEAIDTDGTVGANVIFGSIDETDYWNTVNSCNEGSCLMGALPPPPPPPPPPPLNPDILVYYTFNVHPTDIFITDLNNIGYNVTIIERTAVDELGLTAASPVNLLDYGQVWIIDGCANGPLFTPGEIAAVGTFRGPPHNGGLLLGADDGNLISQCQTRVNQLTQQFNSGNDLFFGDQIAAGGFCYNAVVLTAHPLYVGVTSLSSTASDAEFNIVNPAISVIATHHITGDPYGAVLDDGAGGRIVFDSSFFRFFKNLTDCTLCCQSCGVADPNYNLDCSAEQESIYQQNIAQWLD